MTHAVRNIGWEVVDEVNASVLVLRVAPGDPRRVDSVRSGKVVTGTHRLKIEIWLALSERAILYQKENNVYQKPTFVSSQICQESCVANIVPSCRRSAVTQELRGRKEGREGGRERGAEPERDTGR